MSSLYDAACDAELESIAWGKDERAALPRVATPMPARRKLPVFVDHAPSGTENPTPTKVWGMSVDAFARKQARSKRPMAKCYATLYTSVTGAIVWISSVVERNGQVVYLIKTAEGREGVWSAADFHERWSPLSK